MTRKQVQQAALLTSLPSLLILLVVPAAWWFANTGRVPDWAGFFWLVGFVASIPLALATGVFGLICSFQARLTWGMRLLMLAVNLGAVFLAINVAWEMVSAATSFRMQLY